MSDSNAGQVAHVARIMALAELDCEGRLVDLTYQEIADMLGLGHRSTAMRLMRQVAAVEALVAMLKARFPPA